MKKKRTTLRRGSQTPSNTGWKDLKDYTIIGQVWVGLTKQQGEVYNYLYRYNYNQKKFPTLQKMATYFMKVWDKPLNFQVMDYYMKILYAKGYIIKIIDQITNKPKWHFTHPGIYKAYRDGHIKMLFYTKHKEYVKIKSNIIHDLGGTIANALDTETRKIRYENRGNTKLNRGGKPIKGKTKVQKPVSESILPEL